MGASDEELNDATPQNYDSLLVPIYRIIEKNVSIINLDQIDRHHKRANKTALDYYRDDVTKNSRLELLTKCILNFYSINSFDKSYGEFLQKIDDVMGGTRLE